MPGPLLSTRLSSCLSQAILLHMVSAYQVRCSVRSYIDMGS